MTSQQSQSQPQFLPVVTDITVDGTVVTMNHTLDVEGYEKFIDSQLEQLITEQPALCAGLAQITKLFQQMYEDETIGNVCICGALFTYQCLRRQAESDDMELMEGLFSKK